MKKTLLVFALVLASLVGFSQKERPENALTAELLVKHFNNEQFDRIFEMFSAEMKSALPLEKTVEFFRGIKTDAGNITNMEFKRYGQFGYACYKTSFAKQALLEFDISIDKAAKINGFFAKPYEDKSGPKLDRTTSALILPFNGAWTIVWGGDTKELNYHVENEAQKGAFDIVLTDNNGQSFKGSGQKNEDYYAFGQEILAPCDGEVVAVVNGVKDNNIGETNTYNVGGNMVIIKTINNEYLVLCHFKHNSIKVKEGDKVKSGKVLGLCGNSGNSSEPHLHFHVQNEENLNPAIGAKAFFKSIKVNGILKSDYSPIKGDKVQN